MSVSVLRQRSPRRRTATIVLAALVALLATLGLVRPADADPPPPTATLITVTSVSTPGITVPQTGGTPGAFIVAGTPFTVQTAFTASDGVTLLPISTNQTVTVKLSVASGPDAGATVGTVDVAPGATGATLSATVSSAANHTSLIAKAFIKNKQQTQVLPGAPFFFSPQKTFVSAPGSSPLTSIGAGSVSTQPCAPTSQEPTCAEFYVPQGSDPANPAVLSDQLLSLGACNAASDTDPFAVTCMSNKQSVVQALVQVDPNQINNNNPMLLILKCDKTLCGSQGINKVPVKFSQTADGAGATPPACDVKGQVQAGTSVCVDYRQSTRDNAGDTHLWILLGQDLRVWNG